jgi:hypothetical protein
MERRRSGRTTEKERKSETRNNLAVTMTPKLRKRTKFREAWAGLRRRGWTAKRAPGRLETRWHYIAPGTTSRGVEGDDYLVGEDAVIAYVESHGDSNAIEEQQRPSDVSSTTVSTSANNASTSDVVTSHGGQPSTDNDEGRRGEATAFGVAGDNDTSASLILQDTQTNGDTSASASTPPNLQDMEQNSSASNSWDGDNPSDGAQHLDTLRDEVTASSNTEISAPASVPPHLSLCSKH